jgi:acyl phosphate:glycerol-3-phosphate acyltransferase
MSDTGLLVFSTAVAVAVFVVSYLIGSIPWAFLIVRRVTGEDITAHGTGNVGAMNVRRTTGSWGWFAVAMVADGLKGLIPTLAAKLLVGGPGIDWMVALRPWPTTLAMMNSEWWRDPASYLPMVAVAGAVLGHNYSLWLAIRYRRFHRTGKGLATGGGALLAYDWRYCLVALVVGLLTIAVTRYMMAGQVAAALSLPVFSIATRQPDWPFALLMGLVVYSAHHRRFVGLLQGKEPKLYTNDTAGPRG